MGEHELEKEDKVEHFFPFEMGFTFIEQHC